MISFKYDLLHKTFSNSSESLNKGVLAWLNERKNPRSNSERDPFAARLLSEYYKTAGKPSNASIVHKMNVYKYYCETHGFNKGIDSNDIYYIGKDFESQFDRWDKDYLESQAELAKLEAERLKKKNEEYQRKKRESEERKKADADRRHKELDERRRFEREKKLDENLKDTINKVNEKYNDRAESLKKSFEAANKGNIPLSILFGLMGAVGIGSISGIITKAISSKQLPKLIRSIRSKHPDWDDWDISQEAQRIILKRVKIATGVGAVVGGTTTGILTNKYLKGANRKDYLNQLKNIRARRDRDISKATELRSKGEFTKVH